MKQKIATLFASLLLLTACASIQAPRQSDQQRLWNTQRMMQAHPDVAYRKYAIYLIDSGDDQQAQDALREAARFADKPSQALLAERYWTGEGTMQDRIRGYAWMHLAAEREHPLFRAKRDEYWGGLSQEQRESALALVAELGSIYADIHAKPRAIDTIDKTARLVFRRSHGRSVLIPSAAGWEEFSGQLYFNDNWWNAEHYFEWTDTLWREAPVGRVDIGDIGTIGPETGD